jgi:N-sulfoglucosamine sulfohydrolase
MRIAIGWVCLLAIVLSAAAGAPAADGKLNLLLITADDMNADSAGWMGNKLGATPNLDALAASSCRFVNHHVTVPICQPGRSAFMTGRVPHRNGALGFNPIRTDVPTLVELLQKEGYFAAAINKTAHMAPPSKFPWDKALEGSGKNPKTIRQHMEESLAAAAEAKQPFFINANITDPHRPFFGSDQGKQRAAKPGKKGKQRPLGDQSAVTPYRPEEVTVPSFLEDLPDVRMEVAQYYTSVRRFDVSLGEILAALKASGQEDRTIVVFLSDHGMSFPFSKATVYYNGTHSPLLLRYPNQGQPRQLDPFVSSVDLLPTLLDLLGVAHPAELDGRSLVPLLKGESQEGRDYVVTHVNTVSSGRSFAQRCVRTKDRALMFHGWSDGQTNFRVEAMNGLSYAALAAAGQSDERIAIRVQQLVKGMPLALYDLDRDPGERINVLRDVAYKADVQRLSKLLIEHMQRTSDPQLAAFEAAVGRASGPP